jgi:hypothetical protein
VHGLHRFVFELVVDLSTGHEEGRERAEGRAGRRRDVDDRVVFEWALAPCLAPALLRRAVGASHHFLVDADADLSRKIEEVHRAE